MTVRPLCINPNPVLRTATRPVDAFSDEVRRLARDLIETMHANDGIGLAAPQIGCDLRMFVANPSQQRGRELVVVNPILAEARGRASVIEGCLSLPDVWDRVSRFAHVRLRGCDETGRPLAVEAGGLLAIVLQHEFDHLEGHLFIDRLPWFRRWRLARKIRAAEAQARPGNASRAGRRPEPRPHAGCA